MRNIAKEGSWLWNSLIGMARGRMLAVLAVALLAGLSGCAADGAGGPWTSPLYTDHPLAGKIWKPSDKRYATISEIHAAMNGADFVLIGEKHDNVDHHRLQAMLVAHLAASGRRPALVFEMLTAPQQKALDAYLADNPGDAAGIGAAVGWEKSGWPDWKMYQPIARQALDNDMPMLAAGIERAMTSRIAREGPAALGEGRATALLLDQPVDEGLRAEMRQVIFESHCRQLPESMLDPMVAVTLAKDAVMADRMVQARGPRGVDVSVLIGGAGHVRADWGVPLHLGRRAPEGRLVTVGLIEVEGDVMDPAAYAERYDGRLAFDFVWFTPRVDDNDPCAVFAGQLKRMRERSRESGAGDDN